MQCQAAANNSLPRAQALHILRVSDESPIGDHHGGIRVVRQAAWRASGIGLETNGMRAE